jgi:hypothetical protein|tara:strand:- start:854 stop:1090 length:237 start_codon:yes stop_codon:yes gene_type:complete
LKTTSFAFLILESFLEMLDLSFQLLNPIPQIKLTMMSFLIKPLTTTIHHFRVTQGPGLVWISHRMMLTGKETGWTNQI